MATDPVSTQADLDASIVENKTGAITPTILHRLLTGINSTLVGLVVTVGGYVYLNPAAIAPGSITADKLAPIFAKVASSGAYGDLLGAPSSLPPSGLAGGDLSGSFPLPIVSKIAGKAPAAVATSGAASDVSMIAQGGTSFLSLVRREFLTRPVYAADFGELCDGSTDNRAAYTAAAAYAVAQGRGLEFGSGACLVTSGTVPINGPLYDIGGKGFGVTNVQARFNAPTFTWTVNGGMENFRVHDMTLSSAFATVPTPYPTATTAFDLKGDNAGFVQHGMFDHLRLLGFYAGLTFEKALPANPDSFGYEGTVDWMAFSDISCKTSTQDGQWCVWYKQGSGTGNTFSDMRTTITGSGVSTVTTAAAATSSSTSLTVASANNLYVGNTIAGTGIASGTTVTAISGTTLTLSQAATVANGATLTFTMPAAAVRFDGPANAVVGDQIVIGGHFGGVHAIYSVAFGTAYRSNISVTGSQLDAGVSNIADLPSDAPVFARLLFSGNNVGGGVAPSYPPVASSIIDDQLVDARRAGTGSITLGNNSSAASTPLFSATTGSTTNSNFYGATFCDLTVNGLIGGVAGGGTKASFILPFSPSGFGSPVLDRQVQSAASTSFFTFNASANNGTVTFSAAYTAASGGIINDAQIVCRGGTYSLKRLL